MRRKAEAAATASERMSSARTLSRSSGVTRTQLFAPACETSRPSSSSIRQAFCTVFGLSPRSAESTRREGSSSPSATAPETTPCFRYFIICK